MNRWHSPMFFLAVLLAACHAWGGNRQIIERRIQELDRLNRSVVEQVPDLPGSGQVRLRAWVQPDGTAELLETETIKAPRPSVLQADRDRDGAVAPGTRGTVQASFDPDPDSVATLRSALQDRARGAVQIRPHRDDNANGDYPRLRDALAARIGRTR